MKLRQIIIFLFVLCLIMPVSGDALEKSKSRTSNKQGGEYDVFLLIGQSNMAGRGKMMNGDTLPIEGVYLLNGNGEVVPATNPLNQYSSIRKDIKMQQINPGYSFAKKIYQQTGRKVLLVVNARGGSSIEEWSPENAETKFCEDAVRRTKQAMQRGELKAILWHQGESNSGTPIGYLDKLNALVTTLRSELNTPFVPFIAGEIASWHSNAAKFNPMIAQIATIISNSSFVTSEGSTPLIDHKDPHFSRDGQIILGERYADQVLKMAY